MTKYEYEYYLCFYNDWIRIRILFGLRNLIEYEYEYLDYANNTEYEYE